MKKSLLSFLSLVFFFSCEEDASSRDEVVGVWYMPHPNRVTAGASADRLGGYSLNAWNYSMMVARTSIRNLQTKCPKALER